MKKIIGIMFKNTSRVYYFDSNNIEIHKKDKVIVETEKGVQMGIASTDIIEREDDKIEYKLKKVLRKATKDDENIYQENIEEAKEAFEKCKKLIQKYNLDMKLIDATYTFDKNQLIFHFFSENRIDFRNLAKDLAYIYKTRIELRQVGVRDKAKEIGGVGQCGRILCCSSFLNSFDSVSINMAKNQNLSLTPNKINGCCGRLLCCLSYENDVYEENRKKLPKLNEKLTVKNKKGTVIDLDIIKCEYYIRYENDEIEKIKI